MATPTVRIPISGARGESYADILRRTGLFGVLPGDDDETAIGKLNADTQALLDATELVRDQAADLVLPENIFVAATVALATAAGEAAVADGTIFKAVGTTEGFAEVREATAGGSDLLYSEVTKAGLESNDADKGDAFIGATIGTGRDYTDALPIPVQIFGALGGVGNDDHDAIQDAIDYAYSIGGGTLVTKRNTMHYYSGRILLRPSVTIDFGVNQQTAEAPIGLEGTQLIATDTDGGIDLVAGSHIRATLRTSQVDTFTGPMLEISDAKSTELNFGRNERATSFNVDIRGNRQEDSVGVRIVSSTSSGVAWLRDCVATVGEMDNAVIFKTSGDGYINENWFDFTLYGAITFIQSDHAGDEITANRISATVQPDSNARARRALLWDGTRNFIDLTVWDWKSTHTDATSGGTQVEFTSLSGGNLLTGTLSRGSASGDSTRMPIIDNGSRVANKNIIRVFNGQTQEAVNADRIMPASYFERVYAGDQDDSFAFANKRYTVTVGGSTPPDATSQDRLFNLSAANLVVAACTDFWVQIDLGATPDGMMGLGVLMEAATLPDRVMVEGSADAATWTLLMSAGFDDDPVPLHLLRDNGVGGYRYYRLTVENDAAQEVKINRWWAADAGFARLPGAFLPVYNPSAAGLLTSADGVNVSSDSSGRGYKVAGVRVVRGQQAAIANAAGGDEVAKINAILTALRAHGLIAT